MKNEGRRIKRMGKEEKEKRKGKGRLRQGFRLRVKLRRDNAGEPKKERGKEIIKLLSS